MKPVANLPVSIKPSRRLLLVQLLAHGVAAGAVLASAIAPWIAALLLLLVGASLARQRAAASVAGLLLHADGRCETVGADGTASEVVIHPHTLVLAFCSRSVGQISWPVRAAAGAARFPARAAGCPDSRS